MTVEMKLAVTANDVRSFSETNSEPAWFTTLRESAFAQADRRIQRLTVAAARQ